MLHSICSLVEVVDVAFLLGCGWSLLQKHMKFVIFAWANKVKSFLATISHFHFFGSCSPLYIVRINALSLLFCRDVVLLTRLKGNGIDKGKNGNERKPLEFTPTIYLEKGKKMKTLYNILFNLAGNMHSTFFNLITLSSFS